MNTTMEIRSALIRQGKSLSAWARGAGYCISTVRVYLRRLDSGKSPKGPTAIRIFEDLERDTGVAIPRGN